MSGYEPSPLDVSLTLLLARPILSGYYAGRVRTLKLAGNENVLDFGSGPGLAARHIARALSKREGTLTCVDVSTRWLESARRVLRGYANIEFRLGDIWTLGLADETYDVIFIHFVLHDVDERDRPRIACHLARVLKPGGKLVLREPTSASHGIAPQEIRSLMAGADLNELGLTTHRLLLVQPVCDASYQKSGPLTNSSLPGE
jgi:ubiquinone/menaquinone biosynthesis C-methylase UbiE